MTRAALGVRAHSGWAAVVVLAGTSRSPEVIDRRRIELTKPGIPRQPYHAVEGWELKRAEKLLNRCASVAALQARQAFRGISRDMKKKGYEPMGCGILLASGRPLPTLAATLASHALIHTAEGELFRNALLQACKHCRLPVIRVRERELFQRAAAALRIPESKLAARATELGRSLGPPWRQDEKFGALVAWLALSTRSAD